MNLSPSLDILRRERARIVAEIDALTGQVAGIDLAIGILSEPDQTKPVTAAPVVKQEPAAPAPAPAKLAPIRPARTTAADKVLSTILRLGPDEHGCIRSYSVLARESGVAGGTIAYAVGALEKRGEIVQAGNGGRRLKDWPDAPMQEPKPATTPTTFPPKPKPQGGYEEWLRDSLAHELAALDENTAASVRLIKTLSIACMESMRLERDAHGRDDAQSLHLLARACGASVMAPVLCLARDNADLRKLARQLTKEFEEGATSMAKAQMAARMREGLPE